jgi:hypothetical protein
MTDASTLPPAPLDLKSMLASIASCWPQSEKIDAFTVKLAERPAQNTLMILGLSTLLFFYAERDDNPKINTIYDALEYCSSSLSVGYTHIYPQTPLGKSVASLLMTFGPALSNAVLDGPRSARRDPANDPTQQKILATLEQILSEIRDR